VEGVSQNSKVKSKKSAGSWQLAASSWQLAASSWQLAVGSWQLAASSQVTKKDKVRVKI